MIKFSQDAEYAKLLNVFFYSNLAKNLYIPEFKELNPFAKEISHPILKVILETANIVNTQTSMLL